MDKTYVAYRAGIYRVAHARVTLDSLVYAYWEGHSPETMAQAFWLDPAQVYGTITFYLAHRQEVDESLRTDEAQQEAIRKQRRRWSRPLHQKLAVAKRARKAAR